MIEKIKEGIFRISIPFENIYTSSFVLIENNEVIILDSGNSNEDAEMYIIPEVKKMNVQVKYLILSHAHQDHCGGINALKKAFPNAKELSLKKGNIKDKEKLLLRYEILNLKGHTDDCLGIFDMKTRTLLSCDCLQLYGVDKYRTNISDYDEYMNSIEHVGNLNPDTIVASHEYEPCGYRADGNKEIEIYLAECKAAAESHNKCY